LPAQNIGCRCKRKRRKEGLVDKLSSASAWASWKGEGIHAGGKMGGKKKEEEGRSLPPFV